MKVTMATMAILLAAAHAFAAERAVVEIDGLVSTAPADWEEVPAGGMRVKQFVLKPAKADEHKTELVIFHFGKGQGGSAADNITRWKSMFENAEAKVREETIAGAKTTIVELSGIYLYRARPMDPGAPERRAGQHMIGVVFETPNGPYYMRVVGPEGTVKYHRAAFFKWLRGFARKK